MNTVDEFVESLVAATINNEVTWSAGTPELADVLEEVYGNSDKLYTFFDEEAGANVVFASYQYYAGEVESDEFLKRRKTLKLPQRRQGRRLQFCLTFSSHTYVYIMRQFA